MYSCWPVVVYTVSSVKSILLLQLPPPRVCLWRRGSRHPRRARAPPPPRPARALSWLARGGEVRVPFAPRAGASRSRGVRRGEPTGQHIKVRAYMYYDKLRLYTRVKRDAFNPLLTCHRTRIPEGGPLKLERSCTCTHSTTCDMIHMTTLHNLHAAQVASSLQSSRPQCVFCWETGSLPPLSTIHKSRPAVQSRVTPNPLDPHPS